MSHIQILSDRLPPKTAQCALVLFCPAQARPPDLIARGFLADVRERGIPADVFLPNLSTAHALESAWMYEVESRALVHEGLAPNRETWFAGISLGAYLALRLAARRTSALAGLFLIAPYPGTGDVLLEIEQAGGPRAWAAATGPAGADEREWWRWLSAGRAQENPSPAVYLAAGEDDRFARGQRMLASLLDPDHVRFAPGHHDWETWRSLWQHWLDFGPFAKASISVRAQPTS